MPHSDLTPDMLPVLWLDGNYGKRSAPVDENTKIDGCEPMTKRRCFRDVSERPQSPLWAITKDLFGASLDPNCTGLPALDELAPGDTVLVSTQQPNGLLCQELVIQLIDNISTPLDSDGHVGYTVRELDKLSLYSFGAMSHGQESLTELPRVVHLAEMLATMNPMPVVILTKGDSQMICQCLRSAGLLRYITALCDTSGRMLTRRDDFQCTRMLLPEQVPGGEASSLNAAVHSFIELEKDQFCLDIACALSGTVMYVDDDITDDNHRSCCAVQRDTVHLVHLPREQGGLHAAEITKINQKRAERAYSAFVLDFDHTLTVKHMSKSQYTSYPLYAAPWKKWLTKFNQFHQAPTNESSS